MQVEFEESFVGDGVLFFKKDSILDLMDDLSRMTADVAVDGFGIPGMITAEIMRKEMENSDGLLIVLDDKDLPTAIQFFEIHEDLGNKFVWYGRAMRKVSQGQGLAGLMMRKMVNLINPTMVCAQSQNPAEIRSFSREMRKLGVKNIFPLDVLYDDDEEAKRALEVVVDWFGYETMNVGTGLQSGLYGGKKMGDYKIRLDNPEINLIESRLSELGLNRQAGDAVFYMAFLPRD